MPQPMPARSTWRRPASVPQTHIAGELFKMMTGVNLVHVPYRGAGPALIDLLGGQVQVMFATMSSIEYVRGGKLRALAVRTATRSPVPLLSHDTARKIALAGRAAPGPPTDSRVPAKKPEDPAKKPAPRR